MEFFILHDSADPSVRYSGTIDNPSELCGRKLVPTIFKVFFAENIRNGHVEIGRHEDDYAIAYTKSGVELLCGEWFLINMIPNEKCKVDYNYNNCGYSVAYKDGSECILSDVYRRMENGVQRWAPSKDIVFTAKFLKPIQTVKTYYVDAEGERVEVEAVVLDEDYPTVNKDVYYSVPDGSADSLVALDTRITLGLDVNEQGGY